MGVCLATTRAVKEFVAQLRAAGCRAEQDWKAGVVRVYDPGEDGREVRVYTALQKGRGGSWIVRYNDSGRIKWEGTEEKAHHQPGGK